MRSMKASEATLQKCSSSLTPTVPRSSSDVASTSERRHSQAHSGIDCGHMTEDPYGPHVGARVGVCGCVLADEGIDGGLARETLQCLGFRQLAGSPLSRDTRGRGAERQGIGHSQRAGQLIVQVYAHVTTDTANDALPRVRQ